MLPYNLGSKKVGDMTLLFLSAAENASLPLMFIFKRVGQILDRNRICFNTIDMFAFYSTVIEIGCSRKPKLKVITH